jgi:Carboxypeptidase regulatory-like domain/TonB dependent receptor
MRGPLVPGRKSKQWRRIRSCFLSFSSFLAIANLTSSPVRGQTASTGALAGVTLDPSRVVLPGAAISLINQETSEEESTTSDEQGRFGFQFLTPGKYELQANKPSFEPLRGMVINITVTEVLRIELHLRLARLQQSVRVSSDVLMIQTDNSALGREVSGSTLTNLPLVTRNYAQIAILSPGVVAGVFNAGELGSGGMPLSQISGSSDGIFVHGARSYDNNYQLDGISVNDVQGSGSSSGGLPIPNPDTIYEFKVQTGLYDASYGRYGGANVSVITKTGGNAYHGAFFEFFRNDVLNANDFFLNSTSQQHPALKQNQFGVALGGPILKDKLFFFGSYQGTRQVNGLAAGQARIACTASVSMPPLTNDRSPAALGKLFGGMSGALGGTAVNPDGSNINPVALALLDLKLPNGSFLIPTPQTAGSSALFATQGFSVFTQPCRFDEEQFSANLDYLISPNSKIAAKFFFANDTETVTFPGNGINPSGNIPGFVSPDSSGYRVFSLAHTYTFNSTRLNEARFGYVKTSGDTSATTPFTWSDIGVTAGQMNDTNELPSLNILGSVSIASGYPRSFVQNSFVFTDVFSVIQGAHSIRLGGSITRLQDNVNIVGLGSFLQFLSWPDFLLGLDAQSNGTGTFSNVYASADDFGLFQRNYRAWEGSAFAQDDIRVRKSLTLSLGLRYERFGQFGDELGRNSSFDINNVDPDPPQSGSLAGYVVGSNFQATLPTGVQRANNAAGNYADGQNTIAPRIGFSWQILPRLNRVVLRGGYGVYYSQPTGQAFFQSVFGAPFSDPRFSIGPANASATFQTPFQKPFPTPDSFPLFTPYAPNSSTTIYTVSPNFRPSMIQQFSLNLQWEVHDGWLWEVAYVGARGTHLLRQRSANQAGNATLGNPIRGQTSNTLANISLRAPILGVAPDSMNIVESEGSSWYNGLEVSLTKRLSHGFQFLASYTFSKTLDTDGADINSISAGNTLTLGDQNSPHQRWGRASSDRTHRFVISGNWMLPGPSRGLEQAILGGWELNGVAIVQSGSALTIGLTNASNVFGISEDRAQLTGTCTKNQLLTGGPTGTSLTNYFHKSCFTTPPIIGADGKGAAFGNSDTGIVDGPGQANVDLSLSKLLAFRWPHDGSSFQFRAEFFNAFNHPQFANPEANFSSPSFGVISRTAVNARVGQIGLKFSF